LSVGSGASSAVWILIQSKRPLFTAVVALVLVSALAAIQLQDELLTAAPSPISPSEAQRRLVETFLAVREADIAGAGELGLRELSSRLNEALNATREAEELEMQGRSAEASKLYTRAVAACDEILASARLLREEALRQSFYNRIIAFTLAPVLAFVTTIVLHFGYRWWRRREVRRIFSMEIHLKEETRE